LSREVIKTEEGLLITFLFSELSSCKNCKIYVRGLYLSVIVCYCEQTGNASVRREQFVTGDRLFFRARRPSVCPSVCVSRLSVSLRYSNHARVSITLNRNIVRRCGFEHVSQGRW